MGGAQNFLYLSTQYGDRITRSFKYRDSLHLLEGEYMKSVIVLVCAVLILSAAATALHDTVWTEGVYSWNNWNSAPSQKYYTTAAPWSASFQNYNSYIYTWSNWNTAPTYTTYTTIPSTGSYWFTNTLSNPTYSNNPYIGCWHC